MAEYLEAFAAGLWLVLTPVTFWLLLLGTVIGFLVGLLPGIGGPAAMALMLPFTFTMPPAAAFAFLLGMMAVTGTTGDITSILFGIPGEAHATAAIVDGHPMAKNGEAGRAIGAACTSSLIAAWIGACGLAIAIPVLRPLVLLIGYGEFFMLTVIGVAMVASLTGKSVIKGLIAAGIGFLLAMIGLDPIAGVQRYTFGQIALWEGLGLVVITLGVFAVPELIDLAVKGTSIAGSNAALKGVAGVMEGIKDAFRHFALMFRCSVLGTLLGAIPGMGATVTQWVAYAHAVQSRPNKSEQFGHGAVEGVLAPAAANHSTLAGHLITTVAFGIPGGVVMAILLGAFIIQGIVPGPAMLIPERDGGHLSLTFSFVWTIVIANIIAVIASLALLRPIIRLTYVRAHLLIPFILVLIFLGAFAETNAFASMIVLVVMGLLGWILAALDWPRPPFILGVVLAPLMENNLFLAVSADGAGWLMRPGVILLFALGVVAFVLPFRKQLKSYRGPKLQKASAAQPTTPLHAGYLAFDVFVVVLFALAIYLSWEWPLRTRLFPWIVSWPMLLLAVAHLARDVSRIRKQPPQASRAGLQRGPVIAIWTAIVAFFVSVWCVGFFVAGPLNVFVYLKWIGRESWLLSISLTFAAWLFFTGVFSCFLHIPFPPGVLVRWIEGVFGIDLTVLTQAGLQC